MQKFKKGGSCYVSRYKKDDGKPTVMQDMTAGKPDGDIQRFMAHHGLAGRSNYRNYHMALGLYYAYCVDAFRVAEAVENGEVFDEQEAGIIIRNFHMAYRAADFFRQNLGFETRCFDTAETVMMAESRLEKGKITGSRDNAVRTARMWLSRFLEKSEKAVKEDSVDGRVQSVRQDLFLYEAAVFLLYLAGEEVDYGFLYREKEECPSAGKNAEERIIVG